MRGYVICRLDITEKTDNCNIAGTFIDPASLIDWDRSRIIDRGYAQSTVVVFDFNKARPDELTKEKIGKIEMYMGCKLDGFSLQKAFPSTIYVECEESLIYDGYEICAGIVNVETNEQVTRITLFDSILEGYDENELETAQNIKKLTDYVEGVISNHLAEN